MRLKIGPSSNPFDRKSPTPPPTSTAPTNEVPSKADLSLQFGDLDPTSEPVKVVVHVPPYDLATTNKLIGLSVVVIAAGSPKPTDANEWLTSSYPKVTVSPDHLPGPEGGSVELLVGNVPDGQFEAQLIEGYDL